MTNLSKTQRAVAAAWIVWLAAGLVLFFWPTDVHIRRIWLAIGLAAEGASLALKSHMVPLSPVMQWIDDRAGDGARWYQGWRALASFSALLVGWHSFRVVGETWGTWTIGAVAGAFVVGFLLYHWLRPEKYG